MTTSLDLNDKEQRNKFSEFYEIHPLTIRHTIYYYLSPSQFVFLKLPNKETIRQDAIVARKNYRNKGFKKH